MTTSSTTTKRRPWQRHRERPARREGVRLEPPPEAQIDIYRTMVVLTRRVGGQWRSYPVAPEGVAQALADLPLSSGLLPPDTLGWGMARGEAYLVRYVPPRAVALPVLAAGKTRTYRFTTPPLVWGGRGADYRLWALAAPERPTGDLPLFRAPFPNSYTNGGICWGDVERPPPATPAGLEAALESFFASNFSMHVDNEKSKRYPASVVSLWKQLKAHEPYPLDDLVAAGPGLTLGWLLAGGPWMGGGR